MSRKHTSITINTAQKDRVLIIGCLSTIIFAVHQPCRPVPQPSTCLAHLISYQNPPITCQIHALHHGIYHEDRLCCRYRCHHPCHNPLSADESRSSVPRVRPYTRPLTNGESRGGRKSCENRESRGDMRNLKENNREAAALKQS